MAKLPKSEVKKYTTGFILSLVLTFLAFGLVAQAIQQESGASTSLILTLAGLAIAQLLVQLDYFLHLGKESKPRWNLMMFILAGFIILIIVVGTLWIMENLNYGHNSHGSSNDSNYIMKDEGISR